MMRVFQAILLSVMTLFVGRVYAIEQDVTIECEWGSISATLAQPEVSTDTAVVIVAGSGPTDRNGNSKANLSTYSYKMLSDALVEAGYAVLRYDKRAIGMSSYPSELVPQLVIDDYVDDAVVCANYLCREGYKKVLVAGHSEGGYIAISMALRDDVEIDGLILLCAAGYPMDEILMRQLSAQLVPQYMGLMLRSSNIIQQLKRGENVAENDIPKELISLFHPVVQPFVISTMQYDPAELISRIELPVLIVSGGRDIQVSVDNAERLLQSAPQAVHINYPNMSHVLKDCDTSDRIEQLVSVYTNSQLPLTEGLADDVDKFIKTI